MRGGAANWQLLLSAESMLDGQGRMTGLNLIPVESTIAIFLKAYSCRAIVWVGSTLVVSIIVLCSSGIATAQERPLALGDRKAELEIRKLKLEVAKLNQDSAQLPTWLTSVPGLVVGAAGGATTVWLARGARLGALDQSVHEKRFELYPRLVETTARLALYFPPTKSIDPGESRAIGEAMRDWYFASGGLILSTEARDAYFQFARALTRASLAAELRAPVFPRDAEEISVEKVVEYRKELEREHDLDDVEKWNFGASGSETQKAAFKYKDFVFLQKLSSTLRTMLSKDLRSRRRPASS